MQDAVQLNFMVVPEELERLAYVPDRIRCRIIEPENIILKSVLGESGRKLARAGLEFYFTKLMAEDLIAREIIVESHGQD